METVNGQHFSGAGRPGPGWGRRRSCTGDRSRNLRSGRRRARAPWKGSRGRGGGGGDLVPATALATYGAAGGGRAPVESDRGDVAGWLLALALPGVLAVWLLARPSGERVAVVVTNLANLAGPLVACWVGLRRRGGGRSTGAIVPVTAAATTANAETRGARGQPPPRL